jgi:ATP-binding cassette subfamily B protein
MSDQDELLGKAYDARLAKRIWHYVKQHPGLLVGSLALLPIVMVFDLAQPKLIQHAIDGPIAHGDLRGVGPIALLFLGALAGQSLIGFLQQWFLQLLGQKTTVQLRMDLYRHLLKLRMGFFDRMPVGRLMTRVSSDAEAINEAFAAGLVTIVADFARIGIIIVILFRTDVGLTLVTLAALPVLLGVAALARGRVRQAFRDLRTRLSALNQFLQEHVTGMKIVQMLGRERATEGKFDEKNDGYRKANLLAIKADAGVYAIVEMVGAVAIAALLWASAARIGKGTLTIGVLVAFIAYVERFFQPIRDLSTKYTIMQSAMAAAERIFGLLDVTELDAQKESKAENPTSNAAAIEFDDVRFGYKADEKILDGVSFKVNPGETVAIVGSTGAGKTTIIKLLARLYEIDSGAIRMGGVDVRCIDPDELRRKLVVIPQDVFLFTGTVEENLVLGADVKARLDEAIRRVGADRVLARREAGLDSKVGERGGTFSSGEKQLLALARALARDPEVLILDEATASIDPDTERLVERGIAELARGRTSIVIAHRLSTLQRADRIIVLHKGHVAEQGSHAELLLRGGLYAKLYRLHTTAAAQPAPVPAAAS